MYDAQIIKDEFFKIQKYGGRPAFAKWISDNEIPKFSPSVLTQLVSGDYKAMTEESLQSKIDAFRGLIERFILEKSAGENPDRPEVVAQETSFAGKIWELYFFAVSKSNERYAFLSRTVLEISQDNIPILHRPQLPTIKGRLTKVSDIIYQIDFADPGTYFFNLHITAYLDTVSSLRLGIYTASEMTSIFGGKVVFYLFKNKQIPQTRGLSMFKHKEEFKNVPLEIREFLFRSESNYLHVPSNIFSTKGLTDHNKINFNHHERNSLFFDPDALTVFISTPTFSLDEIEYQKRYNEVNDIIAKVKNRLSNHTLNGLVKIDYPGRKRSENKHGRNFKEVIDSIKQSSLFILIVNEGLMSFTWVELGLALVYAKKILIFGNSNNLPQKLNALRTMINYLDIIESVDSEKIVENIFNSITQIAEK